MNLQFRKPLILAALAAAALIIGGVLVAATAARRHAVSQVVYYCPMHPTYRSDRPGDCPICNMKLVKADPAAPTPVAATTGASNPSASICYLHNCPKAHDGQPCPMTVVAAPGETVICPICGAHVAEAASPTERRILYWTDPMLPGYRADGPGKSPMGMDLVPVYEEADGVAPAGAPSGYAPVLLTPQKQQLVGVKTAPVVRRTITKMIRTSGRVAYDPQLYQTEAEYVESLKSLTRAQAQTQPEAVQEAQRLVDSSRMKLRLMGLNEALINEMAEWDGPDKRLLLADASGQVWLYAPIYEFELPFVAVGQTVRVEVPTSPGTTFEGTIRAIDPVLDPATRSARIRAVLTAPEGVLKPEMFVNASIAVSVGDVLAVPEEAVFSGGTQHIVFVDKGQGLFEPHTVTLGVKADGFYEIKDGLAEGEVVVTSGNFLIDSESRLKAALQHAAPPPAAGPEGAANPPSAAAEGGGGEHQHGP